MDVEICRGRDAGEQINVAMIVRMQYSRSKISRRLPCSIRVPGSRCELCKDLPCLHQNHKCLCFFSTGLYIFHTELDCFFPSCRSLSFPSAKHHRLLFWQLELWPCWFHQLTFSTLITTFTCLSSSLVLSSFETHFEIAIYPDFLTSTPSL